MLIHDADIMGIRCAVRIEDGRICAIGAPDSRPLDGERVIDAAGRALLPGLWDHHIHLNATAAALHSIGCGPRHVRSGPELAALLNTASGTGWLRGVDYHPGIGVDLDRAWLDAHGPDRPIRIQHRSGRMWILNSRACALLGPESPADGRLIDGDGWLRARLQEPPPDLVAVGARLARCGVTGLTEVTPRNDLADLDRYRAAGLPQRLRVMGRRTLDDAGPEVGEVKLHYHEDELPSLDRLAGEIGAAHTAGRAIAAHCVTRGELFLTLAAIDAAGPMPGDRIEHAGIAPPEAVAQTVGLGLTIVTQPHFLVERGDAYRRQVIAEDRPYLYRLGGWRRAGVPLAAGSDAPFGTLDPWEAMDAAVNRPSGFSDDEALTPEDALALFTGSGERPGTPRAIEIGVPADLCLIDRPWREARKALADTQVLMTMVAGRIVYSAIASINPQDNAWPAGMRRPDSIK